MAGNVKVSIPGVPLSGTAIYDLRGQQLASHVHHEHTSYLSLIFNSHHSYLLGSFLADVHWLDGMILSPKGLKTSIILRARNCCQ